MKWFLDRSSEPSTHAGIAILLQSAKAFFPAWAPVLDSATALFGAVAVAISEKGPK
jgi:hypothetical protein